MKKSRKKTSLALATSLAFAIALGFATGSNATAAATTIKVPDGARPMTANELYMLYHDKSWRWPDGAGRMQNADRRFSAWVDGTGGQSWAEGRWAVTDTGLLCLNATWHAANGQFPAKTCFIHRILDGTIYQKRETGGAWFVFRHPITQKADEATNLITDDLVSQRLEVLKTSLAIRKTE
ncbi:MULTISPECIES: DUF995 domain-containing protein [unclassified Rhizobium]|jgi:hypothetical protein|uniref:DUF995 domain-containing protein n=1 Tax=unclassified Rhizobium TaxID=2613769 RepID=UPI0006467031|nr:MULTISPECIES: DUF995 domain-containing protein [unclassified Rhizobium]MBN8954891.1 DUF995 domain-containing protein [Rhizobium tropici]OJY78861.1 MAG: hypothetical protein BGP09_23365 [Rhizobium sp. 60-20]RKD35873.1 uncharacterized protein DUF995 [Rhizobium sp. WW_1]